jgi:ADP-heptose:LPS heptosyltransferase
MQSRQSDQSLPPPEQVQEILLWHRGALGDLLLAGPALQALRNRYVAANIRALGHPERWGLLAGLLSLASVWNEDWGIWAWLFAEEGPLPLELKARLGSVDLAVVFTPRPNLTLMNRLNQAGILQVAWVPAFPDAGNEPVALVQADHLRSLGLDYEPRPFRLLLEPEGGAGKGFAHRPLLCVAPGSGHPRKNWPLSHYFEVTRGLAWEHNLQVVWVTGPAEAVWLPYVQGLAAAQGHEVLAQAPLARVAQVLSRSQLYIGGDSGITHLAAAAGARRVIALFGPTDPKVWAPFGDAVTVVQGPGDCGPCALAREIACPTPQCLQDLPAGRILNLASVLFKQG